MSIPHRRIVMLGPTDSGKTTFISSAYGVMSNGSSVIALRAREQHQHQHLAGLANGIVRGRYPLPTEQRAIYETHLSVSRSHVLTISWIDHRGGAVAERYKASSQLQDLIKDLKAADGVVLFCDGERLATGAVEDLELHNVIPALGQALIGDNALGFLIIVFTKTDKVKKFTEPMLTPLDGLIAAMRLASDRMHCAVIDVSCGARPKNVVGTVEYLALAMLSNETRRLRRQALSDKNLSVSLRAAHKQVPFWTRVDKFMGGAETDRTRARDYEKSAQAADEQANVYAQLSETVANTTKATKKVLVLTKQITSQGCLSFLNRRKRLWVKVGLSMALLFAIIALTWWVNHS